MSLIKSTAARAVRSPRAHPVTTSLAPQLAPMAPARRLTCTREVCDARTRARTDRTRTGDGAQRARHRPKARLGAPRSTAKATGFQCRVRTPHASASLCWTSTRTHKRLATDSTASWARRASSRRALALVGERTSLGSGIGALGGGTRLASEAFAELGPQPSNELYTDLQNFCSAPPGCLITSSLAIILG